MKTRVEKFTILIDNDQKNRDRVADEMRHHHFQVICASTDKDGESKIKSCALSDFNVVGVISDSEELRDLYGKRFSFYYVPTDTLALKELLVRILLEELTIHLSIEQGKLIGAKGESQRTKRLSVEGKLKALENAHKAFETSERLESN